MSGLLMRALLRRRLASPLRLVCLAVLFGQDLVGVAFSGAAGPAEGAHAILVSFLLGAGMIGQERGDGSLALLLTRPVTRAGVVLSAWLATAGGGLAAWLGLTALRLALATLPTIDADWSRELWLQSSLTAICGSLGFAAVIVFFGVAVRGLGGALAHVGLAYLVTSLSGYASSSSSACLRWLAREGVDALLPVPKFAELLQSGGWSWWPLATAASNTSLALLAACCLLGRAQLSYSQGS